MIRMDNDAIAVFLIGLAVLLLGGFIGYGMGYMKGYSEGIFSHERIKCEVEYEDALLRDVPVRCLEYLGVE